MKYKNCRPWRELLCEMLKEDEEATSVIIEALSEKDNLLLIRMVKSIVEGRGGIKKLSRKIGYSKKQIKKCLTKEKHVSVQILNKIFKEYNLDIELVENKRLNYLLENSNL